LSWLHELRATTGSTQEAADFRYCLLRGAPGATGEKESWGSVNYLFEVGKAGAVVRQLQIYDRAPFTYRFNRENPHTENLKGERFAGGLRTEPLRSEEVDEAAITHQQFEHAWLTGYLVSRKIEAP
jgi:hypothetical protein